LSAAASADLEQKSAKQKFANTAGPCLTSEPRGPLAVGREAVVGAFATYVGRIGADPADPDDVQMRKALISGVAIAVTPIAVLWTAFLAAYGELGAAAVPLTYAVLSLLGLLIFAVTRRYVFILGLQLTLWLVLPFVLSAVLGGFAPSGAVFMWGLTAPLGAVALVGPRVAVNWMIGFLILLLASALLQPRLDESNHLPAVAVHALTALNVAGVGGMAFGILLTFVVQRDRASALVRRLLGQYLSPQVVRALISDPQQTALGGALTEVTALFADLSGFTPFTERHKPQETVKVLNRYFGVIVPLIFREGGTIIQFAGDAVVAVFNAPVPQQRHALHAVRAALAMQREIGRIADSDPELPRFRVGVNTGAALVGNVGSQEFRNFVAHGDAVNLGARLQTSAQPGEVLISGTTYALIRDAVVVRPFGRLAVKGKLEEVDAFVVERLSD
jgi:class 3 adenylate cyclase